HANLDRFAELEEAENERRIINQIENWLLPPAPAHLDSPRAGLRAVVLARPAAKQPSLNELAVQLHLFRPRTGEKPRSLADIVELTTRATHEQELFPA